MTQNNANKNEQRRNAVEWDIRRIGKRDIEQSEDNIVVVVMNCDSGDTMHIYSTRFGKFVYWDLCDRHYPSKRAAIRAAKNIMSGCPTW